MNEMENKISPEHIAVIMDGNGRWAEERGRQRSYGHEAGMDTIERVCDALAEYEGIKVLSLYAFSTENWKRPHAEVRFLMNLPERFFERYMPKLQKHEIRVELTGFPDQVPRRTRKVIEQAAEETKNNDRFVLNFALNYGGRQEIVDATRKIAKQVQDGYLSPEDIDEARFDSFLLNTKSTQPYQDIDLLIRTSGEQRLSNFLLWHNAYSELYFTDAYWPDFDEEELAKAITSYYLRSRRYGGI